MKRNKYFFNLNFRARVSNSLSFFARHINIFCYFPSVGRILRHCCRALSGVLDSCSHIIVCRICASLFALLLLLFLLLHCAFVLEPSYEKCTKVLLLA